MSKQNKTNSVAYVLRAVPVYLVYILSHHFLREHGLSSECFLVAVRSAKHQIGFCNITASGFSPAWALVLSSTPWYYYAWQWDCWQADGGYTECSILDKGLKTDSFVSVFFSTLKKIRQGSIWEYHHDRAWHFDRWKGLNTEHYHPCNSITLIAERLP